jgi:hypothetical protein
MKLKPTQVWFPRLGGSILGSAISRDAVRAFGLWKDEHLVWMLPDIHQHVRWEVGGIRNLALPSEKLDRIDLAHVTEEGWTYAPTAENMLPASIDGMLETWLNAPGPEFYPPEPLTILTPHIERDGKISARQRTVTFGPGAYMPFSSVDRENRSVTMRWPPEGSPLPVSPEAESLARFPSKTLGSDPPTVVTEGGDVALHVFLRWAEPFTSMMPVLSSPDDILAQLQMAKIARQSASDPQGALRAAALGAHPHIFQGCATLKDSWFYPALKHKGLRNVFFKAEDHGLSLRSGSSWNEERLKEALKQDDWRKWLAQTVPIRRVWGAVGLFWALLLDRLEERQPFGICERCGRIITGKRGKRFCGKGEDGRCFNNRRAIDKRRSRLEHER